MITLLEHFWIFFIFFAIIVLFRNAKHKLKRNLNESRIKAESAFSKEIYSFFKRSTWLWRVSRKEERRLNRRLKYLGRLRAKAVKRFGCNSRQVELIDRWIAEVQQYTPVRDKIAISCMLIQIREFSSHAITHELYIKNRKRLFCL